MKSIAVLFPTLFFLMCSGPDSRENTGIEAVASDEVFSERSPAMKSALAPVTPIPAEEIDGEITKKNIKTGGITFRSEAVDTDYRRITALLPEYSAYVENENQTKSDQRVQYDLTVRVPSGAYDSLYNRLSNLAGRVEHKYTNIEDVTERYYDLQTRLKNKEALEQRYRELLGKATEIKDMLEIERQLNDVRTEIENLQGQFNYLSKQVRLSTLQLSFYEVLPYAYEDAQRPGFGNRVRSALGNGWSGLQLFVLGLVTIWPFYLLAALAIFLFLTIRKWWKKRQ